MKNDRILVSVCRILFCFDLCQVFIWLLNREYGESWKVFIFDLRAGFTGCEEYVGKLWVIIGFFLFLCVFLLLFIKDEIAFQWHIRVLNKNFSIGWNYKFIFSCLMLVFLLFIGMIGKGIYKGQIQYNIWPGDNIIGHSFGSVDGYQYTGSKEAFEANYEKGYRTFEVDLEITSDDRVVLRHDWDQPIQEGISLENIATQSEFLAIPIYGVYTPLSFEDLCLIMQEHPDIWIVTDSKYSGEEDVKRQFDIIVSTAVACNAEEVLDRLIVQIYNENMYEVLKDIYPFKSFIFTLYQRWDGTSEDFTEICKWCVENNVDAITMECNFWNDEIRSIAERYERDMYLHTVNDISQAVEYHKNGVHGIYTDEIRLEELEEKE